MYFFLKKRVPTGIPNWNLPENFFAGNNTFRLFFFKDFLENNSKYKVDIRFLFTNHTS